MHPSLQLGADLPIDELLRLRRAQSLSLKAYNQAHAEWRKACAARRWWQRKPKEPRIRDFNAPEIACGGRLMGETGVAAGVVAKTRFMRSAGRAGDFP